MARVALDADGVLFTPTWPMLGQWIPGAIEGVRALQEAGHTCFIYSARLSPYWIDGTERNPAEVFQMTQEMRDRLDSAGFQSIDIWTGCGKPYWDILLDDRCERFNGRWKTALTRVLMRVGENEKELRVLLGLKEAESPR